MLLSITCTGSVKKAANINLKKIPCTVFDALLRG